MPIVTDNEKRRRDLEDVRDRLDDQRRDLERLLDESLDLYRDVDRMIDELPEDET